MTEIEPKVSTTSADALVDTTPQLSPSSLLRKAEVKAEELARVKQRHLCYLYSKKFTIMKIIKLVL